MEGKDLKKSKKKILSLLLAASMAATLAGCGNDGQAGTDGAVNAEKDTGSHADGQTQDKTAQDKDGAVAMGRYVEEETDLSELLPEDGNRGIHRREDGSLVILNTFTGFLVSKDEGMTWEAEMPEWLDAMNKDGVYVIDMDMAPDGTVILTYNAGSGDEEWDPMLKLILPDGTEVPVEAELSEDEAYFNHLAVSEDGRIIAGTLAGSLYEIHTDGSAGKFLEAEERPQWMEIQDNLLFMDNDWGTGAMPAIYDMAAEEYVEDAVLQEFTESNYSDRYYNGNNFRSMFLLPGEDQTVYLIGDKGIHRHVVGGNMMEQVVDGNLSMLSNPNYSINSVMRIEGDVFLALFANGSLIRFTYDPAVPAVPENMLKVYSLKDDENMRQAIAAFQSQHPDIFVSYGIGMPEGGSVTRQDAIKKLNTEVMAGTGPDLLVMDDLPLASYVEKGLLLDLTDYLEEYSAKEPLFDSIIDALKIDGRVYTAPATVSIPMVIGEDKYMSDVAGLSDLADAVEALREEKPGKDITGISSRRGVMKRFAPVSAPVWTGDDGKIDRQALGEFLEQCRRIYDAQMDSLDEEIVRGYEERDANLAETYGMDAGKLEWEITHDLFNLVGGSAYLISGWITSGYTWITATSIDRAEGFGNYKAVPMQGQCSQVFKPNTLLAISTASGQPDMAEEFMDFFLSEQVQSEYAGFPVNQGAFDIQFTPKEGYVAEDGGYSYLSMSNQDGLELSYVGYWPTDEQLAAFKNQLANLRTAYILDSMLEDSVFEQGVAYMQGDLSLEQALDEIEKKVSIYMAE